MTAELYVVVRRKDGSFFLRQPREGERGFPITEAWPFARKVAGWVGDGVRAVPGRRRRGTTPTGLVN